MAILSSYTDAVDTALKRIFSSRARGHEAKLYQMLEYFLGFRGQTLRPTREKGSAKRFRPALCLLIAEGYGVRKDALPAAVAIELFHNFTLIHDDIADRDEYRRDRPTLWKLWGDNHALNAGDVQLLMASLLCVNLAKEPSINRELGATLLEAFIEVCEGQYIDFELSAVAVGSREMNEERYFRMTRKKTGALVGAAAEAAGIAGKRGKSERRLLRAYGEALGTAFQIADDYRSVWSTRAQTHKDTHSDIRERKRMLPFIAAYDHSSRRARARLKRLYELPRQLTQKEIQEVRSLIGATNARAYVLSRITSYAKKARAAALLLTLPLYTKRTLIELVDNLVPEGQ